MFRICQNKFATRILSCTFVHLNLTIETPSKGNGLLPYVQDCGLFPAINKKGETILDSVEISLFTLSKNLTQSCRLLNYNGRDVLSAVQAYWKQSLWP